MPVSIKDLNAQNPPTLNYHIKGTPYWYVVTTGLTKKGNQFLVVWKEDTREQAEQSALAKCTRSYEVIPLLTPSIATAMHIIKAELLHQKGCSIDEAIQRIHHKL